MKWWRRGTGKWLGPAILILFIIGGVFNSSLDARRFHAGGGVVSAPGNCVLQQGLLLTSSSANPNFVGGSGSGTTIGVVGPSTTGTCGAPSVSIDDTTYFQAVGTTIKTAATVPVGQYPVAVTTSIAGASNSPLTQLQVITAKGITGVGLGAYYFPCGASSGTVVGAINVPELEGIFSGTLALSGTDAAYFQLSSTSLPANLETNGTPAGCPRAYAVSITPTQAGVGGSGTAHPITVTGQTPLSVGWSVVLHSSTGEFSDATFNQTDAATVYEGTYQGAFVCQQWYRETSSDGNWTVRFRPDCTANTRNEIVVERGRQNTPGCNYAASPPTGDCASDIEDQLTATISYNGTQVDQLCPSCTNQVGWQWWWSRWRRAYAFSGGSWSLTGERPIVNRGIGATAAASLLTLGLVPPYSNAMAYGNPPGPTSYQTGYFVNFAGPMDSVNMSTAMGAPGDRDEIGWTVQPGADYLICTVNSNCNTVGSLTPLTALLSYAEASGSIPWHYRETPGSGMVGIAQTYGVMNLITYGGLVGSDPVVALSGQGDSTFPLQQPPDPQRAPSSGTGTAPTTPVTSLTACSPLSSCGSKFIHGGADYNPQTTCVYSGGESAASPVGTQVATPGFILVVDHPTNCDGGALGWNVYDGVKQNGAPMSLSSDWTAPKVGLKSAWGLSTTHDCQCSYEAFLLTDDPYFLEETQFEGNWASIGNDTYAFAGPWSNSPAIKGLAVDINEPRGTAWSVRNVSDAKLATSLAATLPNSLLPTSYWDATLAQTLPILYAYTVSPSLGFAGLFHAIPIGSASVWEQGYVIQALGAMIASGVFPSGWSNVLSYAIKGQAAFLDGSTAWCQQFVADNDLPLMANPIWPGDGNTNFNISNGALQQYDTAANNTTSAASLQSTMWTGGKAYYAVTGGGIGTYPGYTFSIAGVSPSGYNGTGFTATSGAVTSGPGITTASYNPSTGVVTISAFSSPNNDGIPNNNINPGDWFYIGGATGTGSFASIDGWYQAGAGTVPWGAVTYTIASGLTMTITGGTLTTPVVTAMASNPGSYTSGGTLIGMNNFSSYADALASYLLNGDGDLRGGPKTDLSPVVLDELRQTLTSASWSATGGGQLTVVASPAVYARVVGGSLFIRGATNSGSGGATAINATFTIASVTDGAHFVLSAPASSGVFGTIGGSGIIGLNAGASAISCGANGNNIYAYNTSGNYQIIVQSGMHIARSLGGAYAALAAGANTYLDAQMPAFMGPLGWNGSGADWKDSF